MLRYREREVTQLKVWKLEVFSFTYFVCHVSGINETVPDSKSFKCCFDTSCTNIGEESFLID